VTAKRERQRYRSLERLLPEKLVTLPVMVVLLSQLPESQVAVIRRLDSGKRKLAFEFSRWIFFMTRAFG